MSQWTAEVSEEQQAKRRKQLPEAPETKEAKKGSVTYKQGRQDCTDIFAVYLDGGKEPIIEKRVEHWPALYPHGGMPHNTTIFVDGEKAVSTMLHMKVCVHFEAKEKVESAIAKVVKGAGCGDATEEHWQQACRELAAPELEKLNWYFAVNRVTCPEDCITRHF